MTERMAWRRAVERSRLPGSVRLTLLTHSEQGPGHWHDETRNEHAYPRASLACRLGSDESTIRRHYRRAEQAAFVVLHGVGGNGLQSVFHYVTPSEPWPCECAGQGGRQGGNQGGSLYPLSASLESDRDASLSASPSRSTSPAEPDGFAEWWASYPRKENCRKAARCYAEAVESVTPEVLLSALRRQLPALQERDPQFVPLPANWLRDARWEDDVPASRSPIDASPATYNQPYDPEHERSLHAPRSNNLYG